MPFALTPPEMRKDCGSDPALASRNRRGLIPAGVYDTSVPTMYPGAGSKAIIPLQNSRKTLFSLIPPGVFPFVCFFFFLCSASPLHAEQALPDKPAGEMQEQTSVPPPTEDAQVPQENGEQPSTQNTETSGTGEPPEGAVGETGEEGSDFADVFHRSISRGVLATASWLDSFFYDPRYATEENQSRMVLRLDAFEEKNFKADYSTHVQIKLRLPYLKNKAHLVISGDPEEEGEVNPGGTLGAPVRTDVNKDITQNRQTSTSLGYFFKSDEKRNVNARIGLRYRDGDIVVFLRTHYRVLYKLDGWSLRLTQEFPWWSDTKWESYTAVDLERQFRNTYFFRTSAIGHWYDNQHGYQYTLSAALVQPLSPRRALSYEWVNFFATRPTNKLNEVVLAVRYRQRLWKDWLFAEIAPQVRYPRGRGFDNIPGIWYRLEMQFGWLQ